MEYVLTTNALSKHYGHFKALDGLSMHVPKGAIYGFVGKNGAGKTTLIRLICGLQHPTGGRLCPVWQEQQGKRNCRFTQKNGGSGRDAVGLSGSVRGG